jgi:hypothetical protein
MEKSKSFHLPSLTNPMPLVCAFSIKRSYTFESSAEPPDISRILFVRYMYSYLLRRSYSARSIIISPLSFMLCRQ